MIKKAGFVYRRAHKRDFERIIRFMYYIYKDKNNYVNPDLFDISYLHSISDHSTFFLAEDAAELVGIILTGRNDYYPRASELGTLMISERHRNSGVGESLFAYAISEAEKEGARTFYAHAVMYHDYAQRLCEKNGFVPTGFLFGAAQTQKHYRELGLKSQKHIWACYVKNNSPSEAGDLYLIKDLKTCAENIYKQVNAVYRIKQCGEPCAKSVIITDEQARHSLLNIYISSSGYDLRSSLAELERARSGGLESFIVYLNINHPGALFAAELLLETGYRFSGIKPVCASNEYAIFQKCDMGIFEFSEFKRTEKLNALWKEITGIEE